MPCSTAYGTALLLKRAKWLQQMLVLKQHLWQFCCLQNGRWGTQSRKWPANTATAAGELRARKRVTALPGCSSL